MVETTNMNVEGIWNVLYNAGPRVESGLCTEGSCRAEAALLSPTRRGHTDRSGQA